MRKLKYILFVLVIYIGLLLPSDVRRTPPTIFVGGIPVQASLSEPTAHKPRAYLKFKPTGEAVGSCKAEIGKYSWNQDVAYNVMMQESGGNAGTVNDNPSTGDYSIGCFQINLFGNLRYNRPSEAWLKVAENNVRYAHDMYKSQGWGPWSYHTCRVVACY